MINVILQSVESSPVIWTLCIAGVVLIQWLVLQAFVAEYIVYRRNVKRPRPDGIRMGLMEKSIQLSTEQMETLFTRLASLEREIDSLHVKMSKRVQPNAPQTHHTQSLEASVMSLGEMNLKKRILELSEAQRSN
jgi:hypothetical protein